LRFVLDVSVPLAWYLPGQSSPYAIDLYRRLTDFTDSASIPDLWRTELAAVFLKSVRRGTLTRTAAAAALEEASRMPLALHEIGFEARELFDLGMRYGLTAYDVHYLELARRLGEPLATLDRGLRSAARAHRIPLLES
jgi:predicted nucleic acid-binding protein